MYSIKRKLILLMVGLVVLLAILMGSLTFQIQRETTSKEVETALTALAQEGAEKLALLLQLERAALETLAAQYQVTSMDIETQLSYLAREQERLGYEALAVIDSQGMAHFTDGTVYDFHDRPHIQRVLDGHPTVSEVMISRLTGEPMVAISVPIPTNDGKRAALNARMSGQLLTELVSNIQYGNEGHAYLLNSEGVFQAYHLNTDFVTQQRNLSDLLEDYPYLEDFSQFATGALEKGSGVGHYKVNDSTIHMGYAPVPGTDWVLFAGAFEESVNTALNTFQRQLYPLLAVMILMGVAAAMMVAKHISDPVIKLERLFTRAAGGDLTVRANLRTHDEIGRAGRSFNRMMDRINALTYYDPVTDLPNHQIMNSNFQKMIEPAKCSQDKVAVVVFAADSFNRINEKYGYPVGNQMLKAAAQRIKSCFTRRYHLYRGLSDEFIMLSKDFTTEPEFFRDLQMILEKLKAPYQVQNESVKLTFCLGVAYYPDHGMTIDELLKKAGFAKNMAKRHGSGQMQLFDAQIQQQEMEYRKLEEALSSAVSNNELFIHYQPIVELNSGTFRGVEALLRWKHPELGFIPPDQFIPMAEATGLIHPIGQWTLEMACRQHQEWKSKGMDIPLMSVNISAKQFEKDSFLSDLRRILYQTGMDPAQLEIELTEGAVINQVDESIQRLSQLRDMGLSISIDDFGTGYSSLSYIVRLPIDTLKIDRSFIMNLEHNEQAQAIASTIIKMGQSLKLKLVAEGIENREQLSFICQENCHYGQGYHFSRPVSGHEIEVIYQQLKAGKVSWHESKQQ